MGFLYVDYGTGFKMLSCCLRSTGGKKTNPMAWLCAYITPYSITYSWTASVPDMWDITCLTTQTRAEVLSGFWFAFVRTRVSFSNSCFESRLDIVQAHCCGPRKGETQVKQVKAGALNGQQLQRPQLHQAPGDLNVVYNACFSTHPFYILGDHNALHRVPGQKSETQVHW